MEPSLLENALAYENMLEAAKQAVRNKGAPGIDRMTVDELLPYLEKNHEKLVGCILNGRYRPRPASGWKSRNRTGGCGCWESQRS
ncbi:MAG: hypothetical protein LBW85_09445 [Deltaproteobacteria bacterium]|jgi:retron-type reverse transcriptase|nr:hypothetical protein [Deltaproteobacteria bacterium]